MNKVEQDAALLIGSLQLECIKLRAMVAAMDSAVKAKQSDQYHLLNLSFHDRMLDFAVNRKLTVLYRRLIKELSLFRRMNLADEAVLPVSVTEHRTILKAIASGDPHRRERHEVKGRLVGHRTPIEEVLARTRTA